MFENYYFILGIINNLLLIAIFLSVRFPDLLKTKFFGIAFMALIIPAIIAIIMARLQLKPDQYTIFLSIYMAFIILEGILEFVLKIDFRKNWIVLIPYLMLYWSMNYGFIVMAWKNSKTQGGIMLGLFIIQLFANALSHIKK